MYPPCWGKRSANAHGGTTPSRPTVPVCGRDDEVMVTGPAQRAPSSVIEGLAEPAGGAEKPEATTPWGVARSRAREALEIAAQRMMAESGGPLGEDQDALLEYIDALADGTARALPKAATPPGHVLTPLQRASVEAWERGEVNFAPTAAAAKGDARKAHRDMKDAAAQSTREMHKVNYVELDAVRAVLRAKPPTTRDPAAMARYGGLPGLEPGAPRVLPYKPAPHGHVKLVNAGAMAAAHAEFCGECRSKLPCWIWSFAQKIHDGIGPEWAEGPTPVNPGPDRVPPQSEPLARLCARWQSEGVMDWVDRERVINPTMAFVAVTWQTPLDGKVAEAMAAGGSVAAEALECAAAAMADRTWRAYVGKLVEAGAMGPAGPNAAEISEAWRAALREIAPEAKERLVVASHDLNGACAQTRFSYEKLPDLLKRLKRGWYLAKLDIKSFFYAVPTNAELRGRLGFPVWVQGMLRYAQMNRMSMGHRNSPFIASLISALAHKVLRGRLARAGVSAAEFASLCFVDDFLIAGASRAIVGLALRTLRQILTEFGLDVAESKSTQVEADGSAGVQQMTFLGVAVDTANLAVAVPPEGQLKTARALMVIARALAERKQGQFSAMPANALARAAGLVTRLCEVNTALAPITRAVVSSLGSPRGVLKWGSDQEAENVSRDVNALLRAIRGGGWNRVPLRVPRPVEDPRVLYVTSDFGTGGQHDAVALVIHGVAMCTVSLPSTRGLLVADGELLAVAILLLRYGPAIRGFTVVHGSDALGVTFWLQKNRASHATSNNLLLFVTHLAARFEVELHHVWLSRYGNHVADRRCLGVTPEQLRKEGSACPEPAAQLTIGGTPNEFLRPFAPMVEWADDAWAVTHARK